MSGLWGLLRGWRGLPSAVGWALREAGLQGALVDYSAGTLEVRLTLGDACWLARGLDSAAVRVGGRVEGLAQRGFVVLVPRLDMGCTGTQRGREAMQLFPLCGV